MADDDHLNVDLDVGSNELEGNLRRTFELMKSGLETTNRIRAEWEKTVGQVRNYQTELKAAQDVLLKAPAGSSAEADAKKALDTLKASNAERKRAISEEIELEKGLALARAAADRARSNNRLADGRTVGEAGGSNKALTDAVSGINTTADQLTARLALATGKAMERLLGATTQAMEASYLTAIQRQDAKIAQTRVPGYLDAKTTNAVVAAERAVATAGRGSSLAERNANDFLYQAAVDENRQRTLATNRTRRDAERENKAFDASYKAGQGQLYSDAAYEDRDRSRKMSAIQTEAAWLNKKYDREKAAASAAGPKSAQDRAEESFKNRGAAFDLNGGADQFAFQAKLAANYAIFGAITGVITSSVSAIKEFDDTLTRFQAITGAAGSEMSGFRTQLLDVAKASRFSVNELAEVAITLGQTGLSASDVGKALKPVADLAAASGSSLAQSVEAITGVLGAYGMSAGRAAEVSDILVGALNSTKLTMGQLQLGIQYAANIARDSGVSFSELAATIGAISQAGVKSGSTIGTGVRQLITELTSPTDKLRAVLKELGISLSDVDLRTNGLSGVLKNLSNAGFTTADALRSLDLRAAAAFAAIGGQGDLIERLRTQMLLSSAAAEGAAKANESLSATLQRLQNTAFSVADTAFKPLVSALKEGTDGLTAMIGGFDKLGPILPTIGAGLTGIVATLGLLKVGSLAIGLLTGGFAGPAALAVGALAGVGYLVAQLATLESALGRVETRLDKVKGVENELSSARDAVNLSLGEIDRAIDGVIAKKDKLDTDPLQLKNAIIEAQKGFGDMGFSMNGVEHSADGLVAAYQRLRTEMQKKLPDLGMQQLVANQEKLLALADKQRLQAEASKNETIDGLGEIEGYDNLQNPIYGQLKNKPLDKYRKLGPAFDRAMNIVQDPSLIDEKDPLGSTRGVRAELVLAQNAIGSQLLDEKLKKDADPKKIEELNKQYDLSKEALARFSQATDLAVTREAARQERLILLDQEQINKLKATSEVDGFRVRTDALSAERSRDQAGVLGDKSLNGKERIDKLMAALGVTSTKAKAELSDMDALRDRLIDGGETKENVNAALADARGRLDQIAKNATKELRELVDSLKPEAVLVGQSERRANDATISALSKSAQNATDEDDLVKTTARIKALTEANAQISRDILTFGKTPEQLASDSGLKDQLDALDKETAAKLEKLQEDFVQRRKRIEDAVLRLSSGADKAREQDLRSEASRLEKIAKDAGTVPAKAAELVEQIKKLLDEANEITKRRIGTEAAREIAGAPTGVIPDVRTAPAGSVAEQIITGSRGAGRGDRSSYLLGLGQLESKMNPNAVSETGAKGIFQFTGGTWDKYGKGDVTGVSNQIEAVLKFTEDNAERFSKAMGRAATDAELFVMHNQGGAGGVRLLNNPNTRAADLVDQDAIRVNLPKGMRDQAGTITAGEFTRVLGGYLTSAQKQVGGYTTDAKTILGEKTAAERKKVDEEAAAKNRELNKIVPGKEDQALLAELRLKDKTTTAEIAAAMTQISKASEVGTIAKASSGAIDAYGRLNTQALKEDSLDSKNASRTPEANRDSQEAITERFRVLAEKEALTAAEAAGKISNKVLDEEITRTEAKLSALKLDKNQDKASQGEVDALDQQLIKLKEKRGLEGESQSIKEQIAILEKAIADAAAAGLGPAEKQVLINDRLLELKRKLALTDEQVGLKRSLDNTAPSMSNAFSGAITDFEKSRGILNGDGSLVSETQQARKAITAELQVIGGAFDSLFTNLFTGSMKAGDALKKFATDILGGLMSQLSKSLTNDIFKSLLGGGGSSGLLGSLLGSTGGVDTGLNFLSFAQGGNVPKRMAGGGSVSNNGAPFRDSVNTLLMPDEYVLRKSAADAIGRDNLDQVNALGGAMVNRAPKVEPAKKFGGSSASANVYVVDRDQVPPPSSTEIVHMIGDNISKGGAIKQLIKRVQSGG